MKQELIKSIVRVGNSAGVILPLSWIRGKAKITLIEEPQNIEKELLEILTPYLSDIQAIGIAGSYAREEQTEQSDIDCVVITHTKEGKIQKGKYDILCIPQGKIEKIISNNILPLGPMLREVSPIMNQALFETYREITLTKKNLAFHIETTKSAIKMNKESLALAQELNEKISDSVIYSLILRMRQLYLVECMHIKKKATLIEFKKSIKMITGSLNIYARYQSLKKGNPQKK